MQKVSVLQADRPRNVNAFQAAAILYGDLGTSKAYVIGLAFAIASYSSVWLIAGVAILTILVALNYILICKYYPNGGGVYASVRHRSEVLALLGGFFLICDYLITASLSAVSAFSYLGVDNPALWGGVAIACIGMINFLGPRHTGNLALSVTAFAVVTVVILGVLSITHVDEALKHTQPLHHGIEQNWLDFVGVIVALSGIEAIANMTGVMKIDPASNALRPTVTKTSTPAILMVMVEVCFFTVLFSLAVNALPGLMVSGGDVIAPNGESIRDSMLRYMGEIFGSQLLGPAFGKIFGLIVSIVFAVLLLSAVNTAIVALNSILFVMSRDGQFPKVFQKLNRFGVPILPLVIATTAPILILFVANDVAHLANLYAIGFVGAIATNLGSTSTDKKLDLKLHERIFMFVTFLIMAAVEITLFYEKDHARMFVITVVAIGLLLRALMLERKKKEVYKAPGEPVVVSGIMKKSLEPVVWGEISQAMEGEKSDLPSKLHLQPEQHKLEVTGAVLCSTNHIGKSLNYALKDCKNYQNHLYILFIREQKVLVQNEFFSKDWRQDPDAATVFNYSMEYVGKGNFTFLYDVSDVPALNIVSHAKKLNVSRVIMGMTRTNKMLQIIRGDVISDVYRKLPREVDLIIIS